MKDQLITLIKEYLRDANIACEKFYRVLDHPSDTLSREEQYKAEGMSLVMTHGSGVLIIFDDIKIDFDFDMSGGPNPQIRGFDPWGLSKYAKDNQKGPSVFYDDNKIREVINELVNDGVISKRGTLPAGLPYYFKSDYDYLVKEKLWEKLL